MITGLASDVILSGGEAGARDLTSDSRADAVKRIAKMLTLVTSLLHFTATASRGTVPHPADAGFRMTALRYFPSTTGSSTKLACSGE